MANHCQRCGFVETLYKPLLGSLQTNINAVPHLVLTNDIPTDQEGVEINDQISPGQRDLQLLDHAIDSLEDLVKKLHQGRNEIASHLQKLGSVVSPVRRLPFE